MNGYPSQYISLSEKLKIAPHKKVPDWIIANYNYWSQQASPHIADIDIFQELESVAEGKISTNKYKYIENPFNTDNPDYKRYPARIRNYDIIKPILERYIGERLERPDTQQVYAKNEEVVNEFKVARSQFFEGILQQQFINELNSLGMDTGMDSKEIPGMKDLEDEFILNYTKKRAKYGSESLELLKSQLLLKEKYQKAFYYWLVFGRVYAMKGINYDDVQYSILDPKDVTVIGWNDDSRYAEDAQASIVTKQWSLASIIDNWGPQLIERYGKGIIKQLETRMGSQRLPTSGAVVRNGEFVYTPSGDRYGLENTAMLDVQYINWKSIAKRGILTFINEKGLPDTAIVDDEYRPDPMAGEVNIEWIPENEVWQMIVIADGLTSTNTTFGTNANLNELTGDSEGFAGAIFLEYGPVPVQRNMINNSSICKLPLNGTYFGYDPSIIDSIVKKGISYQELYNIFHYRFELTLAKNKDKLMLFPLGLIPKDKGWTVDTWMYQVHAFSLAFFDETSEKAMAAMQAMKSIDMSLSQYMGQMWEFMQGIRQEWWDSIGMNNQRYGDISSSAGKGTTQQAVYRSSVSTKELNFQFDCFLDQEANGLIDYSKYAWAEGKKGSYITSTGSQVFYDINAEDHATTEYGVFSTSSIEEYDNVQFLKNVLLQPMAQNGTPGSIVTKVIKSNNLAKIEELMEKGEQIQQKLVADQQEQQNETQRYIADSANKMTADSNQVKLDIANIAADSRIEVAKITADSFNAAAGDADGDGIPESDEIMARAYQRQLAREQLQEQKRASLAKEDLARQKVNTSLAVAKENKNKHDN